jgi:hypothetical protein
MKQFNINIIFSFHNHTLTVILVATSGYTPNIINSIDPTKISVYPNYLWVYMHHHLTAQLVEALVLIIYFTKHQHLKRHLKQDFLEFVDFLKKIFGR